VSTREGEIKEELAQLKETDTLDDAVVYHYGFFKGRGLLLQEYLLSYYQVYSLLRMSQTLSDSL
jgi:hypothetical protein